MKNPMRQVKAENDLRAAYLNAENDLELANIIRYLDLCYCKPYEVQLVRKDLIGMALAAQTRGETLHQTIGPDRKAFFESLREEIGPASLADYLAHSLIFLLPLYALFTLTLFAGNGLSSLVSVNFFTLSNLPLWMLLYFLGQRALLRFVPPPYEEGLPRFKQATLSFFVTGVLLFLWWLPSLLFGQGPSVLMPAFVPCLFYLVLTVAFYGYRRHYFSRLAAQKPWQD